MLLLTQRNRSLTTYSRYTSEKPSAMLAIMIPRTMNESNVAARCMMSCAIDARWAPGINLCNTDNSASPLFWANITNTRQPEQTREFSHAADFGFWPKEDGSWRTVSLALPWLNNLTPSLNEADPYQTTLAAIIDRIGMKNDTGNVAPYFEFHPDVEAIVASVIIDGM